MGRMKVNPFMKELKDAEAPKGRSNSVSSWSVLMKSLSQTHHESWEDFTKQTTFHGVKYIFDDGQKYPFRRGLWLVCVLSAITLFMYQVGTRIEDYRNHKSNVNINIIGAKGGLKFPAVTLCNQNTFRLTEAVKSNMFRLLDTFYDTGSADANYSEYYPTNDTDIDTIYGKLAHQKTDFIEWCWWNGQPCDVDKEFKVTKTRLGFCYTFNFDSNNIKKVNNTGGRRSGLKLVINIEQYEYMKGPQDDTGVKMLLHEPGEFPAVLDQGFAASPGTHTIVAVSQSRTNNLPDPFGTCGKEARPQADCLLTCDTIQAEKMCGCRDYYMEQITDNGTLSLCDVRNSLECLPNAATQDSECRLQCLIPCKRTVYVPSLSNSQLSHTNIERTVLKSPTRKPEIKKKYHHAAETFQKVDPDALAANERLSKAVVESVGKVDTKMKYFLSLLETGDTMAEVAKTVNMLANGNKWYTEDFTEFRKSIQHMGAVGTRPINGRPMWKVMDVVQPARKSFFEGYVLGSDKTVLYRDLCKSYKNRFDKNVISGMMNPEVALLGDAMQARALEDILKLFTKYTEKVTDLFGNETNSVMANHVEHATCRRLTTAYNHTLTLFPDEQVKSKCNQGKDFSQAQDVIDMNAILDPFFTQIRSIVSIEDWNLMLITTNMDDTCDWFKKAFNAKKVTYESLNQWTMCQQYDLTVAADISSTLNATTEIMKKALETDFAGFINNTKLYTEGNLTKLELAESFDHDAVFDFIRVMKSKLRELEDKTTELFNFRLHFAKEWIGMTENMINSGFPPVITLGRMKSLHFFNELSDIMGKQHNDQDYASATKTMEEVHNYHAKAFYGNLTTISKQVASLGQEFICDAHSLITNLGEHKNAMAVSNNFFIQNFLTLSIYYRELTYEIVTQQKAFEFLSLLSEIGGFLGLLLGASLLTMCELIDYLVSLATKTCQEKKGDKQQIN